MVTTLILRPQTGRPCSRVCFAKSGFDIIHNFICFNDSADKTVKILVAYHQYFGVRRTVVHALSPLSEGAARLASSDIRRG